VNVLRYAIIEDEPPARSILKSLLDEVAPGSLCLAEAMDGISGMALLRAHRPDVLFLDIEFPPEGAFGMLRQAQSEGITLPPIAFVTAYDRFALEAFRWAACDYLLKPVEPGHLKETLRRLKPIPDVNLLLQTLRSLESKESPERFTVNVKGSIRVLRWRDVSHVRTENRLVFVHTREGRFILDRLLDEVEALLNPAFLRIHRSVLVNLSCVKILIPDTGHTSRLILLDGVELPVSRDRLSEVRRALDQG